MPNYVSHFENGMNPINICEAVKALPLSAPSCLTFWSLLVFFCLWVRSYTISFFVYFTRVLILFDLFYYFLSNTVSFLQHKWKRVILLISIFLLSLDIFGSGSNWSAIDFDFVVFASIIVIVRVGWSSFLPPSLLATTASFTSWISLLSTTSNVWRPSWENMRVTVTS